MKSWGLGVFGDFRASGDIPPTPQTLNPKPLLGGFSDDSEGSGVLEGFRTFSKRPRV